MANYKKYRVYITSQLYGESHPEKWVVTVEDTGIEIANIRAITEHLKQEDSTVRVHAWERVG